MSSPAIARNGAGDATIYQVSGLRPVGHELVGGCPSGDCGVPDDATAVLMNLEVVNACREGNACAPAADTTSAGGDLNFNALDPKMNNANAMVVPLDPDGRIQVEVKAGSHVEPGTEVHTRGASSGFMKAGESESDHRWSCGYDHGPQEAQAPATPDSNLWRH